MTFSPATFLVCHGSRDPRYQIAAERLLYLVKNHRTSLEPKNKTFAPKSTLLLTKNAQCPVELGFLECTDPPLHQQLITFADQVVQQNITEINVFPLFLSSGIHVSQDIPAEVALAQSHLEPQIRLTITPFLGSLSGLIPLLCQRFNQFPAQGRILLAHGSRRSQGNHLIELFSAKLQAIPAYWSINPDLRSQIYTLMQQGCDTIAIMPYFIFAGGIVDQTIQQIEEIKDALPTLSLFLGHPLGATLELAQLIVKEIEK